MGIFKFLLNLFFPPRCASCNKEGDFLCQDCVATLKVKSIAKFSRKSSAGDFEYLDGVIYGADFAANPALQAATWQLKYQYTQELGGLFSRLMGSKLAELSMTQGRQVTLVPIPLHKKRLAKRGFNQAQLLCEGIARNHAAEVLPLLTRVKHTSQQARLGRLDRQKNLEEAFKLSGPLPEIGGGVCFLVDDVCTTGSTLEEAARTLKQAGVLKVYGLVALRAMK